MMDTGTDHEYYAEGCLAKDLPHAQGLLHCLHDAKLQFDRTLAQSPVVASAEAAAHNAQRLFHKLIFAMDKRHHIGMPNVYAYLFGKPLFYSSHTFVALNCTRM